MGKERGEGEREGGRERERESGALPSLLPPNCMQTFGFQTILVVLLSLRLHALRGRDQRIAMVAGRGHPCPTARPTAAARCRSRRSFCTWLRIVEGEAGAGSGGIHPSVAFVVDGVWLAIHFRGRPVPNLPEKSPDGRACHDRLLKSLLRFRTPLKHCRINSHSKSGVKQQSSTSRIPKRSPVATGARHHIVR